MPERYGLAESIQGAKIDSSHPIVKLHDTGKGRRAQSPISSMAAPETVDILDVTGRWSLNRLLSDSLEDTFALVSPSGVYET